MQIANYESAIKDYKTLISIDKNEMSNYSGIFYAYQSLGDSVNGIIYLEKGYVVNPNDPLLLSNLSYEYSQIGKYEKSIFYATKGLTKNPKNDLEALLLNNRGFGFLGLKQLDKALKDINKSITLSPNNSYAYYYRALVNIELKRFNNVCVDLEKAKQLGAINLTEDLISNYCKK